MHLFCFSLIQSSVSRATQLCLRLASAKTEKKKVQADACEANFQI